MESKTMASSPPELVNTPPWKPPRDDNNNHHHHHHSSGMAKVLASLLEPDIKDVSGVENGIPLSPQWLHPKSAPGEPPQTPKSGLNQEPKEGWQDRKWWRNENRKDRWREDERDNAAGQRRERWKEGEAEGKHRWSEKEPAPEGKRAGTERWTDFGLRDAASYEARRDSKWNNRWGPEDKEKEARRERWVDPDKEPDRQGSNPINIRESDQDGSRDRIWRPPHARRGEGAPPPLGTPPKNAPGFGRGRGEGLGRGRSYAPGLLSPGLTHQQAEARRSDNAYRYPRAKLLDIYKSCLGAPPKLPDGFIEVEEITIGEPVEPLAISPPEDEEEAVLNAIQKGDVNGSGTKETRPRPRIGKDDKHKDDETFGDSEELERFASSEGPRRHRRGDSEARAGFARDEREWDDDMDPYKEDKSWKPHARKEGFVEKPKAPVRPEDLHLLYTDPQGAVQGPFVGADIIGWFEAGFFTIDLPVRLADAPDGAAFVPLGNVMPHLKPKARVPPGFDVKGEEASKGLKAGVDVDSDRPGDFAHPGLDDAYLRRMPSFSQIRQPDATGFPLKWSQEDALEPDISKMTIPGLPVRSEVMVPSSTLPSGERNWPRSGSLQHDLQQLQLQPELVFQHLNQQSAFPPPLTSSGILLEQLHPSSQLHQQQQQQQQQQEQLLKLRQQQQLLQKQQQMIQQLQQLDLQQRLQSVAEVRSNRQPEIDASIEKAAAAAAAAAGSRASANPLEQLAQLRHQHESAFRQFFPDERQLMRQLSMPQAQQMPLAMEENRMPGVWELDEFGHFVRTSAPMRVADLPPEPVSQVPSQDQVLENLQRFYGGQAKDPQLEMLGRAPEVLQQKNPASGFGAGGEAAERELYRLQLLHQQQIAANLREVEDPQASVALETLRHLEPVRHPAPPLEPVQPEIWRGAEPVRAEVRPQVEEEKVAAAPADGRPLAPPAWTLKEAPKAAKVIEEETPASAALPADEGEFMEPKEAKKNKKRASKNKQNKATPVVEAPAPAPVAPAKVSGGSKQAQEILPSPPPGPSLADFMFLREEAAAPPQPVAAWSTDANKARAAKPSLKEIQEAERQAREEQDRKLKQQQQMQLQLQQQNAPKPLVTRSSSGSAWQKSPPVPVPAKAGAKPKPKFEDDDDLFWDYGEDVVKPSPKLERQEAKGPAKQVPGFRQAAGAPASTPGSTFDFPSLSSSSKGSSATPQAASSNPKKLPGKNAAPAPAPVNAEAQAFRSWCEAQMRKLTGNDDMTLLEFCVSLPSSVEAGEYLSQYLGSSSSIQAFKSEFLQRKEVLPVEALRSVFSVSAAVISDERKKKAAAAAEEGEFEEVRSGRRKGKKGKKVVDPSLLGFSVTSNRILMGEIQHVED